MSMRCTGEKCPLKGMLDELLGEIKSCTAHNCPDRIVPVTDDEPQTEDDRDSGLVEEDL